MHGPNKSQWKELRLRLLNQQIKVKIENEVLELVNEFKYLGVIVDERLKFESHIKMIKQLIIARLVILKKIRPLIERREALLLYKSYIIPYFDLGNLWYTAANEQLTRGLQTLQNKCIRIINGKYTSSNNTELDHKEISLF